MYMVVLVISSAAFSKSRPNVKLLLNPYIFSLKTKKVRSVIKAGFREIMIDARLAVIYLNP